MTSAPKPTGFDGPERHTLIGLPVDRRPAVSELDALRIWCAALQQENAGLIERAEHHRSAAERGRHIIRTLYARRGENKAALVEMTAERDAYRKAYEAERDAFLALAPRMDVLAARAQSDAEYAVQLLELNERRRAELDAMTRLAAGGAAPQAVEAFEEPERTQQWPSGTEPTDRFDETVVQEQEGGP